VIGDDDGPHRLSPDVDLDLVLEADIAVQKGHADRAHALFPGLNGGDPLGRADPVRDHRPAGDETRGPAAAPHRAAGAGDAFLDQGHGLNDPRKLLDGAEIPVEDPPIGIELARKGLAADEVALEGREAHGDPRERAGENGDRPALGVVAQLVAV
jgi:hypothetical protein